MQDQGIALAATAAERRRSDPTAAPPELEGQGEGQASAGHPNRVAQRDGATVHVHDVGIEPELLHGLDTDRCERLVDLNEVQVGHTEPGLAERVRDGIGRVGDIWLSPLHYVHNNYIVYPIYGLEVLDIRYRLLPQDRLLDEAYDPYAFLRNAYLQRRDYLVTDGKVSDEELKKQEQERLEEEKRILEESGGDDTSTPPEQPQQQPSSTPPEQPPEPK